jgi:hypothetical protein
MSSDGGDAVACYLGAAGDFGEDLYMWAAGTAAALAFNLICTGTRTTHSFGRDESEQYQIVYRIDLGQKRYCEDDCKGLFDIVEVAPRTITLESKGERARPGGDYSLTLVSRETGEHYGVASSGRVPNWVYVKWAGRCERQPFTGFPAISAKF